MPVPSGGDDFDTHVIGWVRELLARERVTSVRHLSPRASRLAPFRDCARDGVFGSFEADAIGIEDFISFTQDAVMLGTPCELDDIPDPPDGGWKGVGFVKFTDRTTDVLGNETVTVICSVQKWHYCLQDKNGRVVGSGQYKPKP